MIRTCLLAAAALALTACNKDRAPQGNQAFSDDDFTAQTIVANDVTAIDAATGDAANMAADVPPDTTLDNEGASDAVATGSNRTETRAKRPTPPRRSPDSDRSDAPAAATATPAAAAGNTAD